MFLGCDFLAVYLLSCLGSDLSGVTTAIAGAGCCEDGVEQLMSFTDATAFLTANLKT